MNNMKRIWNLPDGSRIKIAMKKVEK